MKKQIKWLLASTALLTQPISAQETYFALDEIIISSGLTPLEYVESGRSITVIEEEDISKNGETHLAQALRAVPGIAVTRSGSTGSLTEIRLRGNESNHTLVLIDGVEVSATASGAYDFGALLASDIEKVEVLRGAQSSLYGSNAVGGVISITTKQVTKSGFSGDSGLTFGTDGTAGFNASLGLKGDKGNLRLAFSRLSNNGFDASGDKGELDGEENQSYNLKGEYNLSDNLTLGGTLRYTDRSTQSDQFNFGAARNQDLVTNSLELTETQELFASLFVETEALNGRLLSRLDLSYGENDLQSYATVNAKNGDTSGSREKYFFKSTYALDDQPIAFANHIITGAVEWEKESYKENDPAIVFNPGQLEDRTRIQRAAIVEYQGELKEDLHLQASVRYDRNTSFKDFWTYSLGTSYQFSNETTRLHASLGTAVQNPTLIEQFGFFSNFKGNPDLEPEQSKSWDIGLEHQFWDGTGLFDITYFRQNLTKEIVPDFVTNTPYNAQGESKREGVEISANLPLTQAINFGLNYTWLNATNPNGSKEARRSSDDLSVSLKYQLPNNKTQISTDVRYVSGLTLVDFTAPSFGFDAYEQKDFTTVGFGLIHQFNESVKLQAHIHNVFDESYQEAQGYASQGRTAFLGISTEF